MLYHAYRPLYKYSNQSSIQLPRGTQKVGFGTAAFIMSPNQNETLKLLTSGPINFKMSLFKWYYTDSIYREKIGIKTIIKNYTGELRANFTDSERGDIAMQYVQPGSKKTILGKTYNVAVDLGRWLDLYFTYALKKAPKDICMRFCNFLATRLSDPLFDVYDNKIMVIDLAAWNKSAKEFIMMNSKFLNDPLSILMYAMYKYPELLSGIPNIDILLIDSNAKQLIKIPMEEFTKKNYQKIKSRLAAFSTIVISTDEEDVSTADTENPAFTGIAINPQPITQAEIRATNVAEVKSQLKQQLTYNLLGDKKPVEVEDITTDVIDEFEEEEESSDGNDLTVDDDSDDSDEDLRAEIEAQVSKAIDEIEVDNADTFDDDTVRNISSRISSNIYKSAFMPSHTAKEEEHIKRLAKIQDSIIKPTTFADVKKVVIPETDISKVIRTTNPNIQKLKFSNFDKAYNQKNLMEDVDNAVAALSKADYKIFVIGKEVEDTSDPMNLKVTVTYKLEDEKKRKMTLKFDLPIILEGNYIYVNGSKKLIGHQFILKPIAKTSPTEVQLVTHYNKVFVMRSGRYDTISNMIRAFLFKNQADFGVKLGNGYIKNKKYHTNLTYDMFAKLIYEFSVGDVRIIFDIDYLLAEAKRTGSKDVDKINLDKYVPYGYNRKTHEVYMIAHDASFTNALYEHFDDRDKKSILRINQKASLIRADATIMTTKSANSRAVPVMLFLCFCEGFASIMRKTEIEYHFISNDETDKYDERKYGFIQFKDCILVWKRDPIFNTLMMNAFYDVPTELYEKAELESKETFTFLLSRFYENPNIANSLDNFKNFMIDSVSESILRMYDYPTDLTSLFILAVKMLCDNSFLPENSMHNTRIRSNEVIANIVYEEITKTAYSAYRNSYHKKNLREISIKRSQIIDKLLNDDTRLVSEASSLNPVLELEKARAVTFKGKRGIQVDRALTMRRRGYDESMLGVVGISTSPDSNVGVVRQLTLEPMITNTRGIVDVHGKKHVDKLNSANLFTPAELLTPLGVLHDDPTRTSMSYKQTKYMVLVEDADPVMIGNKVEATVPYYTSDDFSVAADEDGKVVEVNENFVVVQYNKSKKYKSIDISKRIRKNAAAGFYIENELDCDLTVGDKFKAGDVLAFNPKAFTRNDHDRGASMNLGVLTKVAIIPNWDIYEDSTPITESLAERLATVMIGEHNIILNEYSVIDKIVSIGQEVRTGDTLIKFDRLADPEIKRLLDSIREDQREEIIDDTQTTIKSKYTGVVADIKVITTMPGSEFDPSVQKVINAYNRRINKRNATLVKYQNPGDMKYYKSGQIIDEVSGIIGAPGGSVKIKGDYLNKEVKIIIYIKYRDIAAKGDKICHEFALKGICSHVIPKGQEPYTLTDPDEEISTLVAPLAVTARKTPTIFISMFGNKVMVKLKKQLEDIYLHGKDLP